MKKILLAGLLLSTATVFSAEIKVEKGGMKFPDVKIEKVEGTTYMALGSKTGETYVFGLANDVLLDAEKGIPQEQVIGFYDNMSENKLDTELYNVNIQKGILTVKPAFDDFTIEFTKDETAKILKNVKEAK